MTPDAVALHRAILDNPTDDTVRLVYADALDEQGTPKSVARAEFIRVQVALARPTVDEHGGDSQARYALVRREQSLLRKWVGAWLPKPLRAGYPALRVEGKLVWCDPLRGYVVFDRGFVALVGCELPWHAVRVGPAVERFGKHVRALFAANPLESVTVSFEGHAATLTAEIAGCCSGPIEDVFWRIGWTVGSWRHDGESRSYAMPTRAGLGRYLAAWLADAVREPAAAVAIDREAEGADDWPDDGDDWSDEDLDEDEAHELAAEERDEYRETLAEQLGVDPDDIDL